MASASRQAKEAGFNEVVDILKNASVAEVNLFFACGLFPQILFRLATKILTVKLKNCQYQELLSYKIYLLYKKETPSWVLYKRKVEGGGIYTSPPPCLSQHFISWKRLICSG